MTEVKIIKTNLKGSNNKSKSWETFNQTPCK